MKTNCDTIYLCEGPFDALKVHALGQVHGICATCFFTAAPTNRQIDLLHEILPKFRYRYLLLDRGTLPSALRIVSILQGLEVKAIQLPEHLKDPGEIVSTQNLLALAELANRV